MRRAELIFPQELITNIDAMNTLSGGTSEPAIHHSLFPTFRQITVRVPGIAIDNIKVEINNNKLTIYYLITLELQGKAMNFPKGLYNKSIPYFVDVNKISASEEDGALIVRLPYNKLAGDHHRDISISR